MNRQRFLRNVTFAAGALATPKQIFAAKKAGAEPLPADLVKAFVIAGHGNFEDTKQMLEKQPTLLYATYDWGNGDFETALEGAGHVGNKEIAEYLIAKGARTNIFVLTMLGRKEIVLPFLESYPGFIHAKGPHGLTLLHHAQKGGDASKALLEYLQEKGLKETKIEL